MKSEHSGCLTVDDSYTTDPAGEAIDQTIDHLRDTIEHPFVAVELRTDSGRSAYVFHDEVLGQYVLVRRVDVHHIEEPYWTGTDGQPLSWLVEDLVNQIGSSFLVEVELVDKAVMRRRLSDAEFERPRDEALIGGGQREEDNRTGAFDVLGGLPGFVHELTTEPVYTMDATNREGRVNESEWM